ncbi:7-cyano-7-deazaguanine synthase (plasmid) [Halococcus dombrowskii]|uniref:7-cyano-7-deazaguanine synthase n=1 Tax=Halococcus dombrowskii TaxID=179637 RepID=A0AAX3ASZ8_HALDO|nr:7-cyano-7-deazaguanine synthase [Halococcus dombrowskii]UOO97402.1 7-cyano-7-deazaguanine synthase [Halococcus dombrowskii]
MATPSRRRRSAADCDRFDAFGVEPRPQQLLDTDFSTKFTPQKQSTGVLCEVLNLHFLTTAAAVAEHNSETGEDIILYLGAQQNDGEDYPDCRPTFLEAAENAINQSTFQHTIRINTPIINHSKSEVLQLGERLGVDWELTFSCYNDEGGDPCGECPACVEREEAFEDAGVLDPLTYTLLHVQNQIARRNDRA